MIEPTTTFAKIKAANPCRARYELALSKAGGLHNYGADVAITVRQIVEEMGLDDALWCLRTMPEHSARWRLLAVRYARRVQHLLTDPRSLEALDVAERYAKAAAADDELEAAWKAARAAAWATTTEAAWATVDTAEVTARVASWHAAGRAAWRAAWATAFDAAVAASWDPEREWQAKELIRICEQIDAI